MDFSFHAELGLCVGMIFNAENSNSNCEIHLQQKRKKKRKYQITAIHQVLSELKTCATHSHSARRAGQSTASC